MQVNAGPVSQDGSNQMMSRQYDQKSMNIDSQLLQQAHHDDQAQALAAAAQQQQDRSAEYAIQQLQGYQQIKDESQGQGQGQVGSTHHTLHNHHQQLQQPLHNHQLHSHQLQTLHSQLHQDTSISSSNQYPTSINKPVVGSDEYYRIKKYNHKEVERRRRETINKGIDELGKVVPDCDKHKGQILMHAVEYIKMLKDKEETLMKQLTLEKLISEQSINELTSENKTLKAELAQTWKELEHYKREQHE